ncbi:MAG: hypothetical protein CMJ78_18195 [Planctomycetaceae bacterium]|nr:hypothetical protein [Planctomycetaceae bacterium]
MIVIRDNYVFNTGRMCIGLGGDGTMCANNITRIKKDVWRPTVTGENATHGSSTNDNRAIEMRGWRWVVDGNDVSTPGKIADIYVNANRNSGPQPCRNVTIADNTTRSDGILIQGSPASKNVIRDNRHVGGKGRITNNAKAKLSGNKGC